MPVSIWFGQLDLFIGIAILLLLLPVLWWRKHNLSYLLFFSIFWLYLLAVVQVVIFPIMIDTTYHSTTFSPTVNLLPFYFGEDCSITTLCVEGIIENIALTIPFGFGINFLVRVKPRDFLWLPIAVGLGIELSQLAISLAFRSGFRAIDINDAILNATGVYIGYALFMAFGWLYSRIVDRYKLKDKRFFADVYDIVLQTPAIGKSKSA